MKTLLDWKRSSWKYVIARVGPLAVTVERTANPIEREWRVGEVVGLHNRGSRIR